jgi:hypothetical protein
MKHKKRFAYFIVERGFDIAGGGLWMIERTKIVSLKRETWHNILNHTVHKRSSHFSRRRYRSG